VIRCAIQRICAFGQQQTPTSSAIRSRKWKLAYWQNQHARRKPKPSARGAKTGQCCSGQMLPPALGLLSARVCAVRIALTACSICEPPSRSCLVCRTLSLHGKAWQICGRRGIVHCSRKAGLWRRCV